MTIMGKKKAVKYFVVDAFTDSAFKGNPAAVCFLNDDGDSERDDAWLQSLAAEFNVSETCFLTPITGFESRFRLRWFTPLAEVNLCGHATLASAHCLFSNGLVDSDEVEFDTRSGILTAKWVTDTSEVNDGEVKGGTFLIELNFPVVPTCDINLTDVSTMITKALNGATFVDVKATTTNNILVVLPSMESVIELQPRMDDILKCPCDGIIVTAAGSAGSAYDFYSRFFAPKFGVDEDPVCGSAHCALAHYWSLKMNKCDFLAYQVDAFSESAFKGNPAVVCFLDGTNERDDSWLQSLAAEFNIPLTCFVIPITGSHPPDFLLRWFTPTLEVDLCAHATLASAHTLFSDGLVDSDTIKFATRSGILTAKKVSETLKFCDYEQKGSFLIELDFPVIPTCEYNNSDDISMFSKALNGATIVDIRGTITDGIISKAFNGASKASSTDKIIVVVPTWDSVTEMQPRTDDIMKCPGKLIIVTAAATEGSVYDFCSRIFAPKLGVDEDSVCGSAHCALAHYWSIKMNKCDFVVYAASRRSGTVKVHYDKKKQRVLLTGKAVTVMKGSVLA